MTRLTHRRQHTAGPVTTDAPQWLWIPATVALALIIAPLVALAVRAQWANYWALITSDSSRAALGLSLRTASITTMLSIIIGLPLAVLFARLTTYTVRIMRALVLVPLVLPPVVGGIGLLYAFGRRGLVGQHLAVVGIHIPFTEVAVIMAQTFVALPFLVITVEGALRSNHSHYTRVAATLGAPPTTVLTRITLPLIAPAIASGALLVFARALGEFGATLAFAGSLEGVTRTLPLHIYLVRETDAASAVALSLLLIAFALAGVVLTYKGRRPQ